MDVGVLCCQLAVCVHHNTRKAYLWPGYGLEWTVVVHVK